MKSFEYRNPPHGIKVPHKAKIRIFSVNFCVICPVRKVDYIHWSTLQFLFGNGMFQLFFFFFLVPSSVKSRIDSVINQLARIFEKTVYMPFLHLKACVIIRQGMKVMYLLLRNALVICCSWTPVCQLAVPEWKKITRKMKPKNLTAAQLLLIGLFQKKSTPPRRMPRWKFSREGGSSALEIQVGGGV